MSRIFKRKGKIQYCGMGSRDGCLVESLFDINSSLTTDLETKIKENCEGCVNKKMLLDDYDFSKG